MTSEPRAQFRQTGGSHRPALCDPFRLLPLRGGHRQGWRRCEPAQSGWHHTADQRHRQSQFDIAKLLLDKGANPNTWDMNGRTPLYVAIDLNS